MNNDNRYMKQVLNLALKGLGLVSPNPLVGAVIVKNGRVLSTGYHARFGAAHAEIDALKKIKFKAHGATLYCNLEPCCHQGKTPPCVDQVIASGIKRVVMAQKDPNPKVNGRSIKILKKHGIEVVVGVCEAEARYINRFFNTYYEKKRPYVIAKLAVSKDYKIGLLTQKKGSPILISDQQSRYLVHYWRSMVQAILVGKNTAFKDIPRLTVRLQKNSLGKVFIDSYIAGYKLFNKFTLNVSHFKELSNKKPKRIILSSDGTYPKQLKKVAHAGNLVVFGAYKKSLILSKRRIRGLQTLLKALTAESVNCLYVEGGAEVVRSFLDAKLIDEFHLYCSPNKLGEGIDVSFLKNVLPKSPRFTLSIKSDKLRVY